jgi:hypothetical protein
VRFVAVLFAALVFAGPAAAGNLQVAVLPPVEDVSLPFFCDWSYDWDERCYRDDSSRLALGGEPDKVWRSALRFSLGSIPAGAAVVTAELSLWYDRTCVGPRKTSRPCDADGGFELEAHRILTPRWFAEREVEIDPQFYPASLDPFAPPGWLTWDVTDLVAEWQVGDVPNYGLLLKLADAEESYDVPGPLLPSSGYPDPSLRPRLTVWYLPD